MSYTEIHIVSPESYELAGEVKNAWRGAMYVWNQIAQDHFGLESFPMFDEKMQGKVWNAGNHKAISEDEYVVLASTMDHASVKVKDAPRLIKAFRCYAADHPNSSLNEQADLIFEALADFNPSDDHLIMWTQTSVCEFAYLPRTFEELGVNELRELGVDINAEGFDETAIAKYADLSTTFDVIERLDDWLKWVEKGRPEDE